MGFKGRAFSSLFMSAAEGATGNLRNVKGLNNQSLKMARGVSSGRGVGASSGFRATVGKNRMISQKVVKPLNFTKLDYDMGPTVLHASTSKGLSEITPNISAASKHGHYGLDENTAAAFAYRPSVYKNNEEMFYNNLSETASEAARQGGQTTYYLAKAPLSGISTHAQIPSSWAVSSKPLRVMDSITDTGSNRQEILEFLRKASGGEDFATREAKRKLESEATMARLAAEMDPDDIIP